MVQPRQNIEKSELSSHYRAHYRALKGTYYQQVTGASRYELLRRGTRGVERVVGPHVSHSKGHNSVNVGPIYMPLCH